MVIRFQFSRVEQVGWHSNTASGFWREGGEILNADWTKAIYNSPEGVEALQKIIDLRDKYGVLAKDSYLEPDFLSW